MAALRYILIALLIVALLVLAWQRFGPGDSSSDGSERITIAGETFTLEVAADPVSRERGLMGRSEIHADRGMLFVFPDAARRAFWMGHCVIDIDIMFLNEAGRVLATHTMKAEPPQGEGESDSEYRDRLADYESRGPSPVAIELRSGTIARLGIKTGDRIDLDVRRLKRLAR